MAGQHASINHRLILLLTLSGLAASFLFAAYTNAWLERRAEEDARATAMQLVSRSAQMFMVSTERFHRDYTAAATPEAKETVRQDWRRTIFAVDQAVIHDFGADQPRARLIGDTTVIGRPPLGGDNTAIQIPFERAAAEAARNGAKLHEALDGGFLRVSVPLHGDVHAGCAECHGTPVGEHTLFGTLNAYVPLAGILARGHHDTMVTTAILVTILVLMIGGIYYYVYRWVARRLSRLSEATAAAAADLSSGHGDLTRRFADHGNDEIGHLAANFNLFMEKLQEIIRQIAGATGRLASASEQGAAVTQQTGRGILHQQEETERVADGIARISDAAREVVATARDAADAARRAEEEAREGERIVGDAMRSISLLADEVGRASDVIKRLEGNSNQIGSVIDVINGIAEQTNLLALNAAIEAARAGEQGRGFAVVADEVRSLASRTQTSTKEIQAMIHQLQNGTTEAVQVMEQGQSRVGVSVDQARRAGELLAVISGAVADIAGRGRQISAAAEAQDGAAREIRGSIGEIGSVARETAGGARQTAAAAEELAGLAAELNRLVGRFRT